MNRNFKLEESGQIKYLRCRPLDNTDLVINAFTTRSGGVSKYPFDSLNLSYNVGDKESCVRENREIIANILNIDYRNIVSAQQIHRDKITVVKKEDKGRGSFKYTEALAETDALITNVSGIPLLMCYADCVPIFILDPIKKAIGLIHSGRRGTELQITSKTLNKMQKIFGTNPQTCLAAIFPSIGPCCYKIKNQRQINDYWMSKNNFSHKIVSVQNENERSLDLKKANYLQLIKGGIEKKNIFVNEICTADYPKLFFSYRRDKGTTGRMAAIFMLK